MIQIYILYQNLNLYAIMSFKREGNDSDLLGILRKRRIKDLFSEDIPEDEAKLLCNGRLTCLVCSNNPIFDTVAMLGIHRNGKKHLHYLNIFKQKKEDLKHLIAVRQHQKYLEDGTTSIKKAPGSSYRNLSTSLPYNPTVKKVKRSHWDRKPILNLTDCQPSDSNPTFHKSKNSNLIPQKVCGTKTQVKKTFTSTSQLGSHRDSTWRDLCQQQLNGPVMHDRKLKKIFSKRKSTTLSYQRGKSLEHEHYSMQSQLGTSEIPSLDTDNLFKKRVSSDEKSAKSESIRKQYCDEKDSSELAQKYRLLQGSGWKKDWDGRWVKDEEAEFDSDEEPPDLP